MRFMMLVKANKASEAGKMPTEKELADMAKYNEELVDELVAFAAPVFDHRGQVVAAVSVSAPSFHAPAERFPFFVALVVDTAKDISRRMGYSEPPPSETTRDSVSVTE